MIAFLIVCNVVTLLFWLRAVRFISELRTEIYTVQADTIEELQDRLRNTREVVTHTAGEAAKWFRCTRIAHARRKRLQRVTDRLFARVALDGIELALLRGQVDELSTARDRACTALDHSQNLLRSSHDDYDRVIAALGEAEEEIEIKTGLLRDVVAQLKKRKAPTSQKTPSRKGKKS